MGLARDWPGSGPKAGSKRNHYSLDSERGGGERDQKELSLSLSIYLSCDVYFVSSLYGAIPTRGGRRQLSGLADRHPSLFYPYLPTVFLFGGVAVISH